MKKTLYISIILVLLLSIFTYFILSAHRADEKSQDLHRADLSDKEYSTDFGLPPATSLNERSDVIENIKALYVMKEQGKRIDQEAFLYHCGDPDGVMIDPTTDTVESMIYYYDRPNLPNQWVAYAIFRDNRLSNIGFNDASVNDHSSFVPLPKKK